MALPAESPAQPAPAAAPAAPAGLAYADLADLALAADVVAQVRIRRTAPVATPPGATRGRIFVEAETVSLVTGAAGLPGRVSFLADVPLDARARPVRPRNKSEHLVFSRTVPGRPAELQLVAPDAMIAFDAALAGRVRGLLREAGAADAPPAITGIGRAFHVPGTLAGESETQFFLQAAGGRPVSITVLRRPGQTPRWAVALAEIVDDAAAAPARDTLLWYRLACTLPATLPPVSLAEAEPGHAEAIRADYRVVKEGLGPCTRRRAAR